LVAELVVPTLNSIPIHRGAAFISASRSTPRLVSEADAGGGLMLAQSLVGEYAIGEIDGGKLILLRPVVLGMLPLRLVTSFRQQVEATE
jgi:hypothetical protein